MRFPNAHSRIYALSELAIMSALCVARHRCSYIHGGRGSCRGSVKDGVVEEERRGIRNGEESFLDIAEQIGYSNREAAGKCPSPDA